MSDYGLSGETDEDFAQTVSLVKEYKFSQVHISQFYPRPGTPAARMKKVPSNIVKRRSRELTTVFESFTPYNGMEGKVEKIWISDIATDGTHLVGHTKGYVQVLVRGPETMLGKSAMIKIVSVGRWSVFGEVIEVLNQENRTPAVRERSSGALKCTPCSNLDEACACSSEPEPCACDVTGYEGSKQTCIPSDSTEDQNNRNLVRWLLRKRKNFYQKKPEDEIILGPGEVQKKLTPKIQKWGFVDKALLSGIFLSLVIVIALLSYPIALS